jgi:hypothetical protein
MPPKKALAIAPKGAHALRLRRRFGATLRERQACMTIRSRRDTVTFRLPEGVLGSILLGSIVLGSMEMRSIRALDLAGAQRAAPSAAS